MVAKEMEEAPTAGEQPMQKAKGLETSDLVLSTWSALNR
jgi:hypothetical protein